MPSTESPLVLGSSSRYRAELLARLGIPFTRESPDIDERAFDGDLEAIGPEALALKLAHAKADALVRPNGSRLVLCADQVGCARDDSGSVQLLSKPETEERCVDQLMSLAGRTHKLVNGVVLAIERTGERLEAIDVQELTMRAFDRPEAEAYVLEYRPLDSAGGYRIEDAGIRLFERIRSDDYTGIIGLPLLATATLLRRAGRLTPADDAPRRARST